MSEKLLITCTDSMMKQFLEQHVIYLSECGCEVEIACSDVLGRFEEIQEDLENHAKIYKISMQRSPFSFRNIKGYQEIKRIIDHGHYDLIWTNEPVMGALTRLAARKARKKGTKVIYLVHGFHFYQGAPKKNWLFYYPIEKWLSRYTDKMITINEEDHSFAKKNFTCPVFHIHGIGANSGKFHPVDRETQLRMRKELGFDNQYIILNVGELNTNKNQKTAIMALKEIQKQYPDTMLLIAGKGEEKEKLELLVKDKGLEKNVFFIGYTLELERYMWACDALIACSYREGLGLNVIEAMLCGKPVVASRNRGHKELIREGITGYLVDADDTEAFAEKLCHIFAKKPEIRAVAEKYAGPYIDKRVQKELAMILLERGLK